MINKILGIVLFTFLVYTKTNAQTSYIIKGVVQDSTVNIPLQNASVVLLQKDSFIVASTRTDEQGKFVFKNRLDTSSHILFFSYPSYASYSYRLSMKDANNGLIDLNKISLIQKGKLLQEIIIKSQTAAIKIKGDTTEYKADSFKVQPNATVEELLKQLPGLQIDQFGNITAQGQKVKKVLVDGEEFFSDDPTLVTRNLRADMIDRVQVYDKKSDAAAFSGIEDGVRDKTINLKLKEDKNHGIFGKIDMGAGTDEHYNVQGMINFFKGKRRMSAYMTTGNIGRTGIGSADKAKIGADGQGNGTYSGKGVPKATSGGLHYDKKWNKDKESVNGNYKLNIMDVAGSQTTISQNNLPQGIILSNSISSFDNSSTQNSANAKYIHKFDSSSTITIYTDAVLLRSKNLNNSDIQTRRGDSSLIYTNRLTNNNDYSLNTYNLNLSWEKKLKKSGRTISFYLNNNFSSDAGSGKSISNSNFYDENSNLDSTDLLQLQKQINDTWRTLNLNAIYTEPISKKLNLIVNYALNNEEHHDDKQSYNTVSDPTATMIDADFSTKMNSTTLGNQGGVALNYSSKKTILKVGNNVKAVRMNIESLYDPLILKKQFTNWNPYTNIDFKFTNYKGLSFNYNGKGNNPERSQLIPFNYNNSQLITFIPNPELKNDFTNNFNGRYYSTKVASQVYFGGVASYTLISDPITQAITVDPSGAYTYRYVNMDGYTNSTYNFNTFYSWKINPISLQTGFGLNFNGGKSYSPINNTINELINNTYGLAIELFKIKPKKYSIYFIGNGGYSLNKSSLQTKIKNDYFFYELKPSVDIYFPKKFQLHTDADYLWQQKTQTFNENFNRMLWNAWIGKNFLKSDQLTVKLSCNDILDVNNGYSRTATNTFFSENRYTTIRRFFMIGATWNFTKFNNHKQ